MILGQPVTFELMNLFVLFAISGLAPPVTTEQLGSGDEHSVPSLSYAFLLALYSLPANK